MGDTRLGLVIVAVDELQRATAFYRAAFGWPVVVDAPVYTEFVLPGGLRFGLYNREAFAAQAGGHLRADGDGLSGTELYLYPDDLAGAIERVTSAGATSLSPLADRDWGDRAAYFADPDGNVIVLAESLR